KTYGGGPLAISAIFLHFGGGLGLFGLAARSPLLGGVFFLVAADSYFAFGVLSAIMRGYYFFKTRFFE
ncbi:hypothetical protein, partial [Rhizobium phaseoli]|uniref:hypothetical protein n=1 Tax=Rhizobium phaseoli TaxID=396 RepID=UPI001AEEE344